MRRTVLVVDDMEINRMILNEMLADEFEVHEACNGVEAMDALDALETLPDIILLDIIMPEMDGYETIGRIKENPRTKEIPVLFITALDAETNETKALEAGAMDFISKPFNHETVLARVRNHVQLSSYRHKLEVLVLEKTRELDNMHKRMMETLATIIEHRDLESGLHIRRTKELTKVLIDNMLKDEKFHDELVSLNYEAIISATTLHDIGKIGIPDNILLKPGKLTDEEYGVMKMHADIGSKIIATISDDIQDDTMYLKHCYDICRCHHERWDGRGYGLGLKGTEIPLSARIMSVVDVYDALTSKRCYKDIMPFEKAINIIVEGKGTQFDADVVDSFLNVTKEFEELTIQLRDDAAEEE